MIWLSGLEKPETAQAHGAAFAENDKKHGLVWVLHGHTNEKVININRL